MTSLRVLPASNYIANYFHWQRPYAQSIQTVDHPPPLDLEMKYRLQERCADRAKTFYEEEYAPLDEISNRNRKPGEGSMLTVYESHYNPQLNKCFIFAQTKIFPNERKTFTFEVKDVNTRQQYAYYSGYDISQCEVHGTACNSELEWWQLVKPYIEELATF
jgi:hypothetical protein